MNDASKGGRSEAANLSPFLSSHPRQAATIVMEMIAEFGKP